MATNQNPHSHEGAPFPYDQWQLNDGQVAAGCPPSWQCDAALLNDGFMQRTLTAVDGHQYVQTIVAEGPLVGLQNPVDLTYVNETFISLGHADHDRIGEDVATRLDNDWSQISGIAYQQRLREINENNDPIFYTETRGTSGILTDPLDELFIMQSLQLQAEADGDESEQFNMEFVFQRGWFDEDCCDESAGRHALAPGHVKEHKQGKGHGNDAGRGNDTKGHYGETINISQTLVAIDFAAEYRFDVHRHASAEGVIDTVASRLDIAVQLLLEENSMLIGESQYLLKKRTGVYQLTENSGYDPFRKGGDGLSWRTDEGIKYIRQSMTLSVMDADIVSGYESLKILDPFDETVIDEASHFSLLEKGPWIDWEEIIIDPFI